MKIHISGKRTSLYIKNRIGLHFNKGRLLNTGLILTMAFVITACGNNAVEGVDSEENTGASGITLETLDVETMTSVSLQLTENIFVEADVTPYEVYKDGISSYYLITEENIINEDEEYDELISETGADISDLTGLFGVPVETQLSLLETNFACEPNLENSSLTICSENRYFMEIPDQDQVFISCNRFSSEGMGSISYMRSGYEFYEWEQYLSDAISYQVRFEDAEPEEASTEVQEKFAQTKEFLSEMTADAISDYNLCFKLNASDFTYGFLYFYSLDGLPLVCTTQEQSFDDSATFSDTVTPSYTSISSWTGEEINTYVNYPLDQSVVFYLDGELIGISAFKSSQTGAVYKEAKEVIDAKKVLELAQNYYDLLDDTSGKLTITDVRLVYNSSFSDPEDGDVQNILTPFWYLHYYDSSANYAQCNRVLVFDAYTGECFGDYEYYILFNY